MNAAHTVSPSGADDDHPVDTTMLDLIRERSRCLRCYGGFIITGFPRTLRQAQVLDDLLHSKNVRLDAVLNLDAPVERLVSRLSGRRTCPCCRSTYHISSRQPLIHGICDQCGCALAPTPDVPTESMRQRADAYATSIRPLTDYYQKQGLLRTLDASDEPVDLLAQSLDQLMLLDSTP